LAKGLGEGARGEHQQQQGSKTEHGLASEERRSRFLGHGCNLIRDALPGKEKTGMTGTTLHLLWGFFLHGLFAINSRRLPMATTNRRIGMLVGLALLASAVGVWAADWPQWRGPNRDNKVEGFTAPKVWPKAL